VSVPIYVEVTDGSCCCGGCCEFCCICGQTVNTYMTVTAATGLYRCWFLCVGIESFPYTPPGLTLIEHTDAECGGVSGTFFLNLLCPKNDPEDTSGCGPSTLGLSLSSSFMFFSVGDAECDGQTVPPVCGHSYDGCTPPPGGEEATITTDGPLCDEEGFVSQEFLVTTSFGTISIIVTDGPP
jgi:hypothetical protein